MRFSAGLFALMVHAMLPVGESTRKIEPFVQTHSDTILEANRRANHMPPFDTFNASNDGTTQQVKDRAYKKCDWYHPDDCFKLYYTSIEFDEQDPNQFYVSVFSRLQRVINKSFDNTLMESHIHVIVRDDKPGVVSYIITNVYPVENSEKPNENCKVHSREFAVAFKAAGDGLVFLQKAHPHTVPRSYTKVGCVAALTNALQPGKETDDLSCVGITGKLLRMMFEVFLVNACNYLAPLRYLDADTSNQVDVLMKKYDVVQVAKQYSDLVKAFDGIVPFDHNRRKEAIAFWQRNRELLKAIQHHQLKNYDLRHVLNVLEPRERVFPDRPSPLIVGRLPRPPVYERVASHHCQRIKEAYKRLAPILHSQYARLVEKSQSDNVLLYKITRLFEDGVFEESVYNRYVQRTDVAEFVTRMEDGWLLQMPADETDATQVKEVLKETYLWLLALDEER